MELLRGLTSLRRYHRASVATIGAFDGVHRGHQAVISQLLDQGRQHGLDTVLVTFEPLPREYFAGADARARLQCFYEQFQTIAALGVGRLLCLRFDERLRSMTADAFAREIFVEGLRVKSLVLGDDFRFGRDREGDADFMRRLGEAEGFETHPTGTLSHGAARVSSSRLRRALADADFALVRELLGRPFSMSGRVAHGRKLGRTIGAPTANINLRRTTVPLHGVYAVTVDGAGLCAAPGVANVGVRPTVADGQKANLEVHLLDWNGDLYGRRLSVTFHKKIRDEQRFEAFEDLKNQIQRDFLEGRTFFAL